MIYVLVVLAKLEHRMRLITVDEGLTPEELVRHVSAMGQICWRYA